jgi:hypothetical protein
VDGRTTQKRQLVAKKRISAGLEMGGLGIPHSDEISPEDIQYKQHRQQPMAHLPAILAGLLNRANRPILLDHTQSSDLNGGKQEINFKPWNQLIGLSFCAVAELLAIYETSRDS